MSFDCAPPSSVPLSLVTVELVTSVEDCARWQELVKRHHYLGYSALCGRAIRHVVLYDDVWLGVLGWQIGSFKVGCRDRWIGWSRDQQFERSHLIANNTRFAIIERVPNLASRALSLSLKRLSQDMQHLYGHPVLLAETFVDPACFNGICYRAANWTFLGHTKGFARIPGRSAHWVQHNEIKEIYVMALTANAQVQLREDRDKLPRSYRVIQEPPPSSSILNLMYKYAQEIFPSCTKKKTGLRYSQSCLATIIAAGAMANYPRRSSLQKFLIQCDQDQLAAAGCHFSVTHREYKYPSTNIIRKAYDQISWKQIQKIVDYTKEQIASQTVPKYLPENVPQEFTDPIEIPLRNIELLREIFSIDLPDPRSAHGCRHTQQSMYAFRALADMENIEKVQEMVCFVNRLSQVQLGGLRAFYSKTKRRYIAPQRDRLYRFEAELSKETLQKGIDQYKDITSRDSWLRGTDPCSEQTSSNNDSEAADDTADDQNLNVDVSSLETKKSLYACLSKLKDHRAALGRRYSIAHIVCLAILAKLCGGTTMADIARYAAKLSPEELKSIGGYHHKKHGYVAPSETTLDRVIKGINDQELEKIMREFSMQYSNTKQALCLDGKKIRQASNISGTNHIVAAIFEQGTGIPLAQKSSEKGQELEAAKQALKSVDISGRIITCDALYAYPDMAETILGLEANYLFTAVKTNDKTPYGQIDNLPWEDQGSLSDSYEMKNRGHGRIETRAVSLIDLSKIPNHLSDFPGVKTAIKIDRYRGIVETKKEREQREKREKEESKVPDKNKKLEKDHENKKEKKDSDVVPVTKESNNTEYTLTSLSVNEINASFAAAAIRGHWEIENKLHYVKDQNLREDDSVAYKNGISHKHALLNSQAVGVLSLFCSYERKKIKKLTIKELLAPDYSNT